MTQLVSRAAVALVAVVGSAGPAVAQRASATIVSELVPDGHLDPGEGAVLSVCIRNTTPNSFGAFRAEINNSFGPGAVVGAGAAAEFPSLAAGDVACRPMAVRAIAACGVPANVRLLLSGGVNSNEIRFPIGIGPNVLAETFDGVEPFEMSAGWTTAYSPGANPWLVGFRSSTQSPPNRATVSGTSFLTDNILVSPSFVLPAGPTLLAFSNYYNLVYGQDGGVLEIATDGGPFVDIIAAGGAFLQDGYVTTLSQVGPLNNRPAWTGAGAVTTILTLPPAASGRSVQLRWRLGTDFGISSEDWGIDSVYIGTNNCATIPTTTPWGLQTTVNGNNLTFTWQPPLGPAPTNYVLDASLDGGATFPFSFATATTAFSITAPDVAATVRVRAVYSGVPSPPSNLVSFAVGTAAPPGEVTNLLASVNGSELTLAWHPPSSGGTAVATLLEAGTGPGLANLAVMRLPRTATGIVIPGVPNGTYYVRVRQVGPTLSGPPSRDVVVTTPGVCTTPLSIPGGPLITKVGGTVTIAWRLPHIGAAAPSHHVLEAGSGVNTANIAVVPVQGYSLTVTPPPGLYFIRLFSVNSCGTSARTFAEVSFSVP